MNLESAAAEFIKQFEGYTSYAIWDVNAWRIGHGSDTIELPDGTHRRVLKTDNTTSALAAKDLARRIKDEFLPKVSNKIGYPYWEKLPASAKISLLSIGYNYGNITKQAIVDAARTGNMQNLSHAIISSTYNDNSSQSQKVREALRDRRAKEAAFVLTHVDLSDGPPNTSNSKSYLLPVSIVGGVLLFSGIVLIVWHLRTNAKISAKRG